MALVKGICPRCGAEVQLEGSNKVGFCSVCGGKITISEAAERLAKERPPEPEEDVTEKLLDAQTLLTQKNFSAAERIYEEITGRDLDNWAALWGLILARTQGLQPAPIKNPDGFAYSEASDLFRRGGPEISIEWRDAYWNSFTEACRLTVESVDPRVFLELEIFRWYPSSNTFLYPISKDFDIQPILDKTLWEEWKLLEDALPEDRREDFHEQGENCCRRIREYFASGFANLAEIRAGDFSRLLGSWRLKLTTGAHKNDVMSFTQNSVGVPHLDAFRTSVNSYDHYRYIKVDHNNRLTVVEHRHFPSQTGMGGDFVSYEEPEPVFNIMAVYEYILILPSSLYSRTELQKIPNADRALIFMQQCKAMPCFKRTSLKNAVHMRPIIDNEETGEPSKRMRACYIATAVYGDIDAPEVRRLRRFRDESLNTTRLGRRLCAFYYKFSPALAERIKPGGAASRFVRGLLDIFVRRLKD